MSFKKIFSPYVIYYLTILILLYTPIAILVIFSFNEGSTLVFPLKGMTVKWYEELFKATSLLSDVE